MGAFVGGTADSKLVSMMVSIMNNGGANIPANSLAIGPCMTWGNINQYMNSNVSLLPSTSYTSSSQIYKNMGVIIADAIPAGGYYYTNVSFNSTFYPADIAAHPAAYIRNMGVECNSSAGATNLDIGGQLFFSRY
jgi:hypothetical protein